VGGLRGVGLYGEYTSILVKRVTCSYISQQILQVPNLVIKNYFDVSLILFIISDNFIRVVSCHMFSIVN